MKYPYRTLFWVTHTSVWIGFSLLNLVGRFMLISDGMSFFPLFMKVEVISNLASFILAWTLTLALVPVFSWISRKNYRIYWTIPLILILNLIWTSIIVCLLIYSLSFLLPQLLSFPFIPSQMVIVSNILNFYLVILVWTAIFFGVLYLIRLREARIEHFKLQTALNQAQLNTLIGQINPHFLFNALNNIRSLILEDPDKARHMVTQLAEMLRLSLKKDQEDYIPIAKEMEFVDKFISLAKIQLEERLSLEIQVPENLESCLIPPMTIQILVENAIKHGISRLKNGGLLKITVNQDHNNLHIQVANPGCMEASQNEKSTGAGLWNLSQRLNIMYKGNASFEIKEIDGCVCARVTLPLGQEL